MDAFTKFKYAQLQREMELSEVVRLINTGNYDRLSEACEDVGLNPHSLSQEEVNYIKKRVIDF